MLFVDLVQTSAAVAQNSGRLAKIAALAAFIRRVEPSQVHIAIAFLSGVPTQGRIGVGWALLERATAPPAGEPSLTLTDVDQTLAAIAQTKGAGSAEHRKRLLWALLARATAPEQDFLMRLIFGELRQGALEGVLIDAVAKAADVPAAIVRRAAMMTGDLGLVAREALASGADGLSRFNIVTMRPVDPMLAETADTVEAALQRLGRAAFEWKLDGARIQVHKHEGEVRVFSRNLRDVTPAAPEVVEAVSALPARSLVLDGEVIALRPDGTPHPFQTTMRRFGRRLDVERLRAELPLTPFFFDCLLRDEEPLVDRPQRERFSILQDVLEGRAIVPHLVTDSVSEAEAFLDDALRRGHEGVMAKALDAAYAAGRRGLSWLKIKQATTLDLVVLAAEWGSGRRKGWLSNLHLGARHETGFVMLGKTFKGLTDEMLRWQTARLLELETHRDSITVYVRPELIVEIAFNDIQVSPIYPGGLALRFARVKGYRTDKSAAEADAFETVQALYRKTTGLEPPPTRL
ncbi:MAG TPA: ATP-dependent DNA ligase [Vicinamibacterales bacterium]|nr:ATP-dependent DNA ligase [Vicinamibacterales bacterium]